MGVPLADLPKEDIYHGSCSSTTRATNFDEPSFFSSRPRLVPRSTVQRRPYAHALYANDAPSRPARPARLRQYVPPRPRSRPRFRLLHQLSVRNSSHSHPDPPAPPSQPSSPPRKSLHLHAASLVCSHDPQNNHSHSPNLVFLTIGLFPPQIRVTSGSLVVISLPCPSSHGRP